MSNFHQLLKYFLSAVHSYSHSVCYKGKCHCYSAMDSVTLKAYKVKDCGQYLGSGAYEMPNMFFFLLPVLKLAIEEVKKEEKKNLGQKIPGKTQNPKVVNFFILVSDLDSGIVTVSDLDNNSL